MFEIKVASGSCCIIILALLYCFFSPFIYNSKISMRNACRWESIYFPLSNHSVQLSPRPCVMRTMSNYLLFTFCIKFINAEAWPFFSFLSSQSSFWIEEYLYLSLFAVPWFTCGIAGTGTAHLCMVSWRWALCFSLTLSKLFLLFVFLIIQEHYSCALREQPKLTQDFLPEWITKVGNSG